MKKIALVGVAAAAVLALSACGSPTSNFANDDLDWGGYNPNGGYASSDWDMNNGSIYNNNTYCGGGTYNPMANNQYSCTRNGVTSTPSVRPPVVVPPKSAQKPPADFKPVPKPGAQPKSNTGSNSGSSGSKSSTSSGSKSSSSGSSSGSKSSSSGSSSSSGGKK